MPNVFANVLNRARRNAESVPETATAEAGTAVLTALRTEAPIIHIGEDISSVRPPDDWYNVSTLNGVSQYSYGPGVSARWRGYWPWEGMPAGTGVTTAAEEKTERAVVEEPSRAMLEHVEPLKPDEIKAIDLEDEDRKLAIEAEAMLGYRMLREKLQIPGLLRRTLDRLEIQVLDQKSVDAYKAQMVAHYETTNKMAMPTWRLTALKDYKQEIPKFALRKAAQIKRELPEAEIYIDQLAMDPFLIVSFKPIYDSMINQTTRGLEPETQAYIEVWNEPDFEAKL